MGFNRRKMEDRCRQAAEKEAAARRAIEKQILEDADHLVAVWNERQAKRVPMLFSPTSAPPLRPAIGSCRRAVSPFPDHALEAGNPGNYQLFNC
jgi:hypothetical protein